MPELTKISEVGLDLLSTTSRRTYAAHAAVVWCMDRRARRAREEFIRTSGYKLEDLIQVAGGIQGLVGDKPHPQRYLLRQLELAVEKHGAPEVALMAHVECAMFRAQLRTMQIRTSRKEKRFLAERLATGVKLVRDHLARMRFVGRVRGVLVCWDGQYEVAA